MELYLFVSHSTCLCGLGLMQLWGLILLPRVPAPPPILSQVCVPLCGRCRTRDCRSSILSEASRAGLGSAHFQTLWLQLVGSFLSFSLLHTHPSSDPLLLWAPAWYTELTAYQRPLRSHAFGQVLGMDTDAVCSSSYPES